MKVKVSDATQNAFDSIESSPWPKKNLFFPKKLFFPNTSFSVTPQQLEFTSVDGQKHSVEITLSAGVKFQLFFLFFSFMYFSKMSESVGALRCRNRP